MIIMTIEQRLMYTILTSGSFNKKNNTFIDLQAYRENVIHSELRRGDIYGWGALIYRVLTLPSPRQNIMLAFNEEKRKSKTAVIPKRLILSPRIT